MTGLLLDSLNANTGDRAILDVMRAFLVSAGVDFEILSPLGFDRSRYETIVIGGGHILREEGDWFYDTFRVPGPHILNAAGTTATSRLEYLNQYRYVSVRSQADRQRIGPTVSEVAVTPCVAMALIPASGAVREAEDAIGFQFDEFSWKAAGGLQLFRVFHDYRQCFLPVTFYNGDHQLLRRLGSETGDRVPVLPRMAPRQVLASIGRMKALVCASLHAAMFAYARNIPFTVFRSHGKIEDFMRDRGLDRWIFANGRELRENLAALLDRPPDYSGLIAADQQQIRAHFRRLRELLPGRAGPATAPAPKLDDDANSKLEMLAMALNNRLTVLERTIENLGRENRAMQERIAAQDAAKRPLGGDPFGHLDSPEPGAALARLHYVRGWALAAGGIDSVTIGIDGEQSVEAVTGEHRPDVAAAHPGWAGSESSGWGALVDFSKFPGSGTLTVDVRSRSGRHARIAQIEIRVAAEGEPGE